MNIHYYCQAYQNVNFITQIKILGFILSIEVYFLRETINVCDFRKAMM